MCIIPMNLISCIFYYSINLNAVYAYKFWVFVAILNLAYFCSGIYGLFLASLSKRQEALSIISIVSKT